MYKNPKTTTNEEQGQKPKVFYTASYHGKSKYQKEYDSVTAALSKCDVELISPELGNYMQLLSKSDAARFKHPEAIHYEAIRRGINWADIVVIEISNQDFQLGHEATLAMQSKKPLLCLSVLTDYTDVIRNRYFHAAKYSKYNVQSTISDFINRQRRELLSVRFNCFLSSGQINYLETISKQQGLNKSEYLRMLIEKDRADSQE